MKAFLMYCKMNHNHINFFSSSSKNMKQRLFCLIAILSITLIELSIPTHLEAAELTEVADAAEKKNPFDLVADVVYRRHLRRSKITREYNCNPAVMPSDLDTCASAPIEGQNLQIKELRYQRITSEIVPRLKVGLWRDLELMIEAPVVITDDQNLRYAGNGGDPDQEAITAENSTIAPSNPADRMFNVPFNKSRSGFGDMAFMFRYAPISNERDATRGDWVIELGYRAPTGTAMKGNNSGVGRGVHELILATALSRRFKYIDPYVRFEYIQPFAYSSPFYKDYGAQQQYVGPGARFRFDFGSEFIPYDNLKQGVKIYVDLGLGVGYQAEGRGYSELFDAFYAGTKTCGKMDNGMSNVDQKDNCLYYNRDANSTIRNTFDGITTIEQYTILRGHIGFGFYLSQYVKLGANFSLAHETEHFITNSKIGKDLNGDGVVDANGAFNPQNATDVAQAAEHNPTYVPNVDSIGRRIRVEETTLFTTAINLSFLF
jgi:hypothetical protein